MGPSGPQAGRIWRQHWEWSTSSFAESAQFGGTSLSISASFVQQLLHLYFWTTLGFVQASLSLAVWPCQVIYFLFSCLFYHSSCAFLAWLSDYSPSCRSSPLSTEAKQPVRSSLRWFMRSVVLSSSKLSWENPPLLLTWISGWAPILRGQDIQRHIAAFLCTRCCKSLSSAPQTHCTQQLTSFLLFLNPLLINLSTNKKLLDLSAVYLARKMASCSGRNRSPGTAERQLFWAGNSL